MISSFVSYSGYAGHNKIAYWMYIETDLCRILGQWDILLLNFTPSLRFSFTNAAVVTIKDKTSKKNVKPIGPASVSQSFFRCLTHHLTQK